MARKSSLLIILLAVLVAQPASSQVFWQFGPHERPGDVLTVTASGVADNPLSEINGARPAVGTIGEIAIAEAILRPGDLVPLPVYADGSVASDGEIFWTAHLWKAHFPDRANPPIETAPDYGLGDNFVGGFEGRLWRGGSATIGIVPGNTPPDRYSPKSFNLEVLVTVVALRSFGPTPITPKTWGKLKSRYR